MTDHNQSRHHRHTVLTLRVALMIALVSCLAHSAELTLGVNWYAWTKAVLASPEGQRVQKSQLSEKEMAQWLASKVTKKMDKVGIVPTTGVFDHLGNWVLNRRGGNCADVAMIFEDVFNAAGMGQPLNIEVRVSEDDDHVFSSVSDPLGCNNGHGVLALSLGGVVYVFDPWMDSCTQFLLRKERWSYGHYQRDSKWNAMPVTDWWDSMQEAGYTRFRVGTAGHKGSQSSQFHTNSISGVADIKTACADYLESKDMDTIKSDCIKISASSKMVELHPNAGTFNAKGKYPAKEHKVTIVFKNNCGAPGMIRFSCVAGWDHSKKAYSKPFTLTIEEGGTEEGTAKITFMVYTSKYTGGTLFNCTGTVKIRGQSIPWKASG